MQIKDLVKKGEIELNNFKIEESSLKVKLLLSYLLCRSKEYIFIHDSEEIDDVIYAKFMKGINQLINGVPIQYITHKQEFFGLDFYVDENVLIPQPDTETLVEEIIQYCKKNYINNFNNNYAINFAYDNVYNHNGFNANNCTNIYLSNNSSNKFNKNKLDANTKSIRILDLCTGSGAIAIVLKKNLEKLSAFENNMKINNNSLSKINEYTNTSEINDYNGLSKINNYKNIPEINDYNDISKINSNKINSNYTLDNARNYYNIKEMKDYEFVEIYASDISIEALKIARLNAKNNNVNINFVNSDIFSSFEKENYYKFDIIVSNPPYIETNVINTLPNEVRHEPKIALDGGEDGLDFYRKIIKDARKFLNENGILAVEIGFNQKDSVIKIFEQYNYKNIYSKKDLAGNDRIVIGKV